MSIDRLEQLRNLSGVGAETDDSLFFFEEEEAVPEPESNKIPPVVPPVIDDEKASKAVSRLIGTSQFRFFKQVFKAKQPGHQYEMLLELMSSLKVRPATYNILRQSIRGDLVKKRELVRK